ncbi:hypothetical protein [Paenibacillus sp. BR1-192]|uniref:hypothetical protein n=1 Tax=Paenibacillus sp. BR1-192 TaxID=3032287 RepID=UPI00240D9930|nr:hypothetical protein [Paenibacillus sp. BR1-192]WFB57481.1 hypothetical protein P0X86_26485 [Paenibacillus sp. BR1-192]
MKYDCNLCGKGKAVSKVRNCYGTELGICGYCYGVVAKGIIVEEPQVNEPLLIIEVEDMESVPTVRYKGEKVEGKIDVSYSWETSDAFNRGSHKVHIKHFDKDQNSVKTLGIERLSIPAHPNL